MSDLVGETIGAYRITERLGRGGMADVYKAFHTALEVHRAVKFIRPEFVTSDDFKARFQKEAQGVARLSHPKFSAFSCSKYSNPAAQPSRARSEQGR